MRVAASDVNPSDRTRDLGGQAFELKGVEPQALRWGHQVSVDDRLGAVRATVPLQLTPGRQGFGPALQLVYGAEDEGSLWGDSWQLTGLDFVGYFTRDGLPQYDGRDRYAWADQELLVARNDAGAPRTWVRGDFDVVCYRPRVERQPVRVERWTARATGAMHWRVRHADGSVSVYGRRADGSTRVEDSATNRIWRWLLEARFHPLGDAMTLDYLTDGRARYPKRIRYAFTSPVREHDEGPLPSYRLEVVFDYGDHEALEPIADGAPAMRPDPRRSGRAGFVQRWSFRCSRILMFHRFPEHLGEPSTCVGETRIQYGEHRMIRQLDFTGRRIDAGVHTTRSLRSLRFSYAEPTVCDHFEQLPASAAELPSPGARMVDLLGEGVAGVLLAGSGGAHYARALGAGEFAPREPVSQLPSLGFDGSFVDFDDDGDQELFSSEWRYRRMDRNAEQWQPGRCLAGAPLQGAVPWRAVDLTGDGRADLVAVDQDGLTYLPNLGELGYGVAVRVALLDDRLPLGARVRRLLADMTGDGLADLVAIDNGSVRYWPGLGHGRFGEMVELDGVGPFDFVDQFSLDHLVLADVTGTGTMDLLYVRQGVVSVWLNEHGERLRLAGSLEGLPPVRAQDLRVLDVLADQTACLVWSPASAGGSPPLFLRLQQTAAGAGPRQLLSCDEGGLSVVELEYECAARQYLRDREAGEPWFERARHRIVPILHRVRDCVAADDQLGGGRSETTYVFRNPKYDGHERRFVGYLTVEALQGRRHPLLRTVPTLTRMYLFSGDPAQGREGGPRIYGSGMDPPAFDSLGWPQPDHADAMSALLGELHQVEVYSADDTSVPLEVRTARPRVVQLQAGSNDLSTRRQRSGFAIRPFEQLRTTIEGDASVLGGVLSANDPRREHQLVLEVDSYGTPRLTAEVAYGRARSATPRLEEQHRVIARATVLEPIVIDDDAHFQVALPAESAAYELAVAESAQLLQADPLATSVRAAIALPAAIDDGRLEPPPSGVRARLLSKKQTFYRGDAGDAPLPLGQTAWPALVHHHREACFDATSLQRHLGARYDAGRLRALHYELEEGIWWRDQATQAYEPPDRFYRLRRTVRSDTATTCFQHDGDALTLTAVTDSLGLTVTAEIDANTLLPHRVDDPNQAVSEVQRDPLGVVVRTTRYGRALAASGSPVRYGYAALDRTQPVPTVQQALERPEMCLADLASLTVYDLESTPPCVVVLANEHLPSNVEASAVEPRAAVGILYFDGLGRSLQEKQRVENGPAFERDASGELQLSEAGTGPRWRGNGHVVTDSQQRAVRQHRPFHSRTPEFERDASLWQLGATSTKHFDPLGRSLWVDEPNGSYSRVEYTPWLRREFDANDTVAETGNAYREARRSLDPLTDDEGFALARSLDHADTPKTVHLDPSGREIATDDLFEGRNPRNRQELDGRGQPIAVWDRRERIAHEYVRDLLGRILVTTSIDGGRKLTLADAFDRPADEWTAVEDHKRVVHDLADRPCEIWWERGTRRWLSVENVFGEGLPDARLRNALGRLVLQRDEAGELEVLRYSPFGEPLHETRRLHRHLDAPDWRATVELEATSYDVITVRDGLGRWIEKQLPDGSTRRRRYLRGGGVGSLVVWTAGGRLRQTILADNVLDALGRSTAQVMGNGVRIEHAFDPVTERLTFSRTAGIQAITRVYDAAGRLVRTRDAEQEPGRENVLRGQRVRSHRDFYYDTLDRLRRSTGRYHRALQPDDHPAKWWATDVYRGTRHVNDGLQVTRYQQTYTYDDAGNLREIDHRPEPGHAGPSWVTRKWVSDTSNRQLPATDTAGMAWPRPEEHFDAAGHCLRLDTVHSIDWDPAGRLARAVIVSRPEGTDDDERYQYGADGRRVRRIRRRVIDVATGLVETVEVISLEGGELTRTGYGDGRPSALRWASHCRSEADVLWATLHQEVAERPDDAGVHVHFALVDERGSVTHELNDRGGLITYEEYFPYGSTAFVCGDILRDVPRRLLRFLGKIQDDVTGLYYFEHRYYSPYIGNWLSPDPAGAVDSSNLYEYVGGDPINRVDPHGLWGIGFNFGPDGISLSVDTPLGSADVDLRPQGARITVEGPHVSATIEADTQGARASVVTSGGSTRVDAHPEGVEATLATPRGHARAEASRARGLEASLTTRQGTTSISIPEPRAELEVAAQSVDSETAAVAQAALSGLEVAGRIAEHIEDSVQEVRQLVDQVQRRAEDPANARNPSGSQPSASDRAGEPQANSPPNEERGLAAAVGDRLRGSPTAQFVTGYAAGLAAGFALGGFLFSAWVNGSGTAEQMPRGFMLAYGFGETTASAFQIALGLTAGIGGGGSMAGGVAVAETGVGAPAGAVAVGAGGAVTAVAAVLIAEGVLDWYVGTTTFWRAYQRPNDSPLTSYYEGNSGSGNINPSGGGGGNRQGSSGTRDGDGGPRDGDGAGSGSGGGGGLPPNGGTGGGGTGPGGGGPHGGPPLEITIVQRPDPHAHNLARRQLRRSVEPHDDPPWGLSRQGPDLVPEHYPHSGYACALDLSTGRTAAVPTAPTQDTLRVRFLEPRQGGHWVAAWLLRPDLMPGDLPDPNLVGFTVLHYGDHLEYGFRTTMLHGDGTRLPPLAAIPDIMRAIRALFHLDSNPLALQLPLVPTP